MQVYGQLVNAQLEGKVSDHAATVVGMIWWDTTLNQVRMADGSTVFNILANNTKCILGNHATAANNIRFHRGASGVLQFVAGDDATAEGTLSTSLAQLSSRAENYATGSLPAVGNAGRLVFDSSTTTLKFDTGIAWQEVAAGLNTSVKNYVLAQNLTAGDPVTLNDAGTLTSISKNSIVLGTPAQLGTVATTGFGSCFDSYNNKVVVVYIDGSDGGIPKTLIGTIALNTISFGSPVNISATASAYVSCCFDSVSNKVIICYLDGAGAAAVGKTVTGTVSGDSMTLGTPADFSANVPADIYCMFIPSINKHIILYRDTEDTDQGKGILGSVVAGEVTYAGSTVSTFSALRVQYINCCYDSLNDKVVIAYQDIDTDIGYLISANINVNPITYGTAHEVIGGSSTVNSIRCAFDNVNNKVLVAYTNGASDNEGTLQVLKLLPGDTFYSVSTLEFYPASTTELSIKYYEMDNRFIITYRDNTTGLSSVVIGYLLNNYPVISASAYDYANSTSTEKRPDVIVVDSFNDRSGIFYEDAGDSNKLTCIPIKLLTPKRCVGVLNATGTTGQTKAVTLQGGLASIYTGKTPGYPAYIQEDLSIGYKKTKYPIGQFVSETELLVMKGE